MARVHAIACGSLCAALAACLGAGRKAEVDVAPPVVVPPPADIEDVQSEDEQPYAMTISGGVSLGAYEAGLNWAVIELMRTHTSRQVPRLLGVTGASAGSINALLTAMRWCEAEPTSTAQNNLFAQAWLPIGFDRLLPGQGGDYFAAGEEWPQDLLLSRKKAFSDILRTVEERLKRPHYRNCELKLGFTVTSMAPRVLALRGLRVRNQRFVIPLVVRAVDGRIHFAVDTSIQENQRQDLLGNLLFLAPSASGGDTFEVEYKDVIRAALASSAYPFAFGPVELSYCARRDECGAADATRSDACSRLVAKVGMGDNGVACRKRFIDGGVFDNVPLGVAMAQIESTLPASGDPVTHRPLRYIYMYPGNRRDPADLAAPAALAREPRTSRSGPLGDTLAFLGGAVDTASDYELHNVLRYNLWNAGTPQLGEAVAAALTGDSAPSAAQPLDVDRAVARAAELAGRAEARSLDRTALAGLLRDSSRALEQIASQPTDKSADLRKQDLDAYVAIRQSILKAVVAICGNQDAGPGHPCGAKRHELLLQARELQNDIRNERRLILSRRFSPLAGTHIAHFGAFLDAPLRDYDYYAGIYDALWSVAELSCDIMEAQQTGRHTDEVQQQAQVPVQAPPRPLPARFAEMVRRTCRRTEFENARKRLRLAPGSPEFDVTEQLWAAEHRAEPPRPPPGAIGKTMQALFDPVRCRESEVNQGEGERDRTMCLKDLDLAAFAAALARAGYQPADDSPFMKWVLEHPVSGWWALPGVFAAGRLVRLARAEGMGMTSVGAAITESYLESYVDQHSTPTLVAPSSLPDRGMTRWAGLLFPFAALSLDPTRRFELGLLRGGVRLGPKGDVSGWRTFLPWDLLLDLSGRVAVRPPGADEDDRGYGLFTRGSTTLHASFAPTLRVGGVLWSIGLRAGVPVPLGALRSTYSFEDQVNSEVVATFLGDKLRFAFGCNPMQEPRPRDCWRDLYYSFGVNDLAGLAYWTGWNPYKLERLFIPFAAARVSTDVPSAEIGLVRAGWQPWRLVGLWTDASVVLGPDPTANASVAYEADLGWWVRRLGIRGGLPLSIRKDARIKDSNIELVLTFPHGIRVAAGTFAFHVFEQEEPWADESYVSVGWDPGSLLLTAARALQPARE